MKIHFHPHTLERMQERGATKEEIRLTIEHGEQFPGKFNRIGFRHNFPYDRKWRDKYYKNKQVEAYAVREKNELIVLTIITRYF